MSAVLTAVIGIVLPPVVVAAHGLLSDWRAWRRTQEQDTEQAGAWLESLRPEEEETSMFRLTFSTRDNGRTIGPDAVRHFLRVAGRHGHPVRHIRGGYLVALPNGTRAAMVRAEE